VKIMSPEKVFKNLAERYPALVPVLGDIIKAYELICDCYDRLGKVLVCGNGGSAADADHIVGELMKGFLLKRPLSDNEKIFFEDLGAAELAQKLQGALPAVSLNAHTALYSAFCNDVAEDTVLAQQVWGYSKNSPDILIALSTSGSSRNVVNAAVAANAIGIDSVGITGRDGGKLAELCTVCIRIPETETYKVQELTQPVYHAVCAALEAKFFG
jgi:D-sedoheptulose 7-phosphate isomerase